MEISTATIQYTESTLHPYSTQQLILKCENKACPELI